MAYSAKRAKVKREKISRLTKQLAKINIGKVTSFDYDEDQEKELVKQIEDIYSERAKGHILDLKYGCMRRGRKIPSIPITWKYRGRMLN